MRVLLCLGFGLLTAAAHAEIYQYTDDKGNRVYTNQPPSGVNSRSVELKSPNTIQALPAEQLQAPATEPTDAPSETDAKGPYRILALPAFEDDEAFRANGGNFAVHVTIDPPLEAEHRLQLLLNGAPHGPAIHARILEAIHIPRGAHELSVQVVSEGKVLQTSAAQRINIQRVNTQSPAQRPTPLPRVLP